MRSCNSCFGLDSRPARRTTYNEIKPAHGEGKSRGPIIKPRLHDKNPTLHARPWHSRPILANDSASDITLHRNVIFQNRSGKGQVVLKSLKEFWNLGFTKQGLEMTWMNKAAVQILRLDARLSTTLAIPFVARRLSVLKFFCELFAWQADISKSSCLAWRQQQTFCGYHFEGIRSWILRMRWHFSCRITMLSYVYDDGTWWTDVFIMIVFIVGHWPAQG